MTDPAPSPDDARPEPVTPAPGPTPAYPGWSAEQPPAAPTWTSPTAPPPAGPTGYPAPGGMPGAAQGGPPPGGWIRPQAPKPGVIPLRPLGLSEILDGAFTYIRRSPAVVLGISAVIAVLSNIVQFVFSLNLISSTSSSSVLLDQNAAPEDLTPIFGQLVGTTAITLTITLLFQVIGTGMLTVVITRAVLGQDIGWSEAWQRSRGLILALVGVTIVTGALSVFGLLFCLVPGIFLYVSWALAVPALMVERCGVFESMRRSWRLVRGSRWRVLGIVVLAQVITYLIAQLVGAPFAVAGILIDGFGADGFTSEGVPWATLVLSAIGGVVATTITLPFTAGVVALLYVDQRMRKEGLDLQLARATERSAAANAPTWPPSDQPPSNPTPSPWTTGP